jgi:hypothetical protein
VSDKVAERSVRSIVSGIQVELRDGEVVPSRAREMLMTLTSLLGNCTAELTRAEAAYTQVLAMWLETEQKANRARIRAEMSPEFAAKQDAKNTATLVIELMRSLKVILRSVEEEMRLAK